MANRTTKVSLVAEVSGYIAGMQRAGAATREMSQDSEARLAKQREAFDLLGRASLTAGTIALAGAVLATKAAIDWETAWTGVTKTVEGTPEQLAEIEAGLRSLSGELPTTHRELAAVAEAAGQLGVERSSIIAFTKTMVDLGATTNLTADEAATSIAQLMNIMQTAPDQVDNLGAALVALGNDGASTERDIVQMAQRIAGAAKTIGLSEGEVLGFANALASAGIEVEAGGSAISNIMIDIARAVSDGGPKLETFAKTAGLSADEFSQAFKDKPAEAIATFIEGLGGISAAGGDVFGTLAELGQTDVRVTRALLGMANSGDLLRESLQLGNDAFAENIALAVEAEKRYATTASQIAIAGNKVHDAAIDFGQVFLPAVSAGAEAVGDFADSFNELPAPMQTVVAVAGVLTAAVLLGSGAFMLAVPQIARYQAALATLGPVAQRTAGILSDLGKTAAVIAVLGVADEFLRWVDGLRGATVSSDSLAKSLMNVSAARKAIDNAVKGGGSAFDFSNGAKGITNLNVLLTDQGRLLGDVQNSWAGTALRIASFGASDSSLGNAKKNMEELDQAMAQLVNSGNTEAAERAFQELVKQTDGSEESIAALKQILPEYAAAQDSAVPSTTAAADAYLETADAAVQLDDKLRKLIGSINTANGLGQDAVTANANYQASLAATADYIAQAQAGIEGYTLGFDRNTAAGAANQAMIANQASDLLAAAEAQLLVDNNVDNYLATVAAGQQTILDQAAALGATDEQLKFIAESVIAIPDRKAIEVIAETAEAQRRLDAIRRTVDEINSRGLVLGAAGTYGSNNENGGFYKGGVKAFADGGFASGIYEGGQNIHKFAETGLPWETYISPKPGQRARNVSLWEQTGKLLGASDSGGATTVTINAKGEDSVSVSERIYQRLNAGLARL